MRSGPSFILFTCVFTIMAALCGRLSAEPPDMAKLMDVARRHHLPTPPAEAQLVLAHTGSSSLLGNKSTSRDPGIYAPAFLLEEKPDGTVTVLRGTKQQTLSPRHGGEKLWLPWSLEQVTPKLGGHVASFNRLSAFVCAVQIALRGDETLALKLWTMAGEGRRIKEIDFGDDTRGQLKDPPLLLARCLFDHWRNQLLVSGSDWKLIHARMGAVLDEFPALKTGQRPEIFAGLTASVNAKQAAPGSIEALLLDWSRRPGDRLHPGIFDKPTDEENAPARQIVLRGFDAVPGLLALLNDQRVTAHEQPAFMKAPAWLRTLGELAADLLEEITGVSSSARQGTSAEAAFRAWWEQHRGGDESTALAGASFTRKNREITEVNTGPLRILAAKYPARLAPLCDEFSKHAGSRLQPHALAEAIATCQLPKEEKVSVLSSFAARGSREHQRCVLQNLAKVDGAKCAELLLPMLRALPQDVNGAYWTCPEASFSHVVMLLDDAAVWREFFAAARRASAGLRMQYMNPMNYNYIGEQNRAWRLAFLAAFLEDDAVRKQGGEDDAKYDGPCAAFTFPVISVRDFAAMQIASILDMPDAPDEFWTAEQWSGLRAKVQSSIKSIKLPPLDTGSR